MRSPSKSHDRRAACALAAVALLLCACATEDSVVEPGVIDFGGDPVRIDAPSSARVGESFVVTVTTYGGGCIELERTDVELTDDGADITPLDRRRVPGPCTLVLHLFPHEVTLTFATAGTKTIHIHGRRVKGELDEEIELPRTILVE